MRTTTRAQARWHGPLSLIGAIVGLAVTSLPYTGVVEGNLTWVPLVVSPLVGLLLWMIPGRARQVATGLVASGLAVPVGMAPFVLLAS